MIVNKYTKGSGGGSTSGVTPEQVQTLIDRSLAPYWDSAATESAIAEAVSGISLEGYATSGDMQSAFTLISETQQVAAAGLNQLEGRIDELSAATPSVDLSGYYTSAQTEEAISAATSGKADAANLSTGDRNPGDCWFPKWNEQGIITGKAGLRNFQIRFDINGVRNRVTSPDNGYIPSIWAPLSVGTAGDILVSTGNGAPVWSAVTMPDMSDYYTSAQTKTYVDDKVSSAETQVAQSFANLDTNVIQPMQEDIQELSGRSVDLSAYWTSAETQDAIDESLSAYTPTTGFSTINGSAITNGGNIVIEGGADMSAYYTSAQTEEAISAATSGKADAANVTANTTMKFPLWNEQGVITGTTGNNLATTGFYLNGTRRTLIKDLMSGDLGDAYAPTTPGSAGQVLVSTGNGAPVWSAVTFPDVSNYVTSAQVETQIEAKNYVNSGDVKSQVEAYNYATVSQIPTVPTSNTAFTNDAGYITDAAIENLVTSAQVETQITSKGYATVSQIPTVPTSNTAFTNDAGYVTSAQVETQIVEKNYITSAAIANMVSSTYVSTIWRGTQSDYDAIVDKDPNTFYIIVNN